MKKLFFISLSICIASLLFLIVYVLVYKESSAPLPTPEPKDDGKDVFGQGEQSGDAISLVYNEPVSAATVDKENESVVFYTQRTGRSFSSDTQTGLQTRRTEQEIPNIDAIEWSSDGANEIIQTTDEAGQRRFFVFDTENEDRIDMNATVDVATWASDGKKILYKTFSPEENTRTLFISNREQTETKRLSSVPFRLVEIAQIPRSALVALWPVPNAFEGSQLLTVPITGGEPVELFSGRFGANYLFSPDGRTILVSSSASEGSDQLVLATVNSNGGEYTNLQFPTMVDKCVWSFDNKTIYCALPGGSHDAVLPNDWQEERYRTKDTFWSIDVETGKKERFVEIDDITDTYDASNVFLSANEDAFFFINRYDSRLYKIKL